MKPNALLIACLLCLGLASACTYHNVEDDLAPDITPTNPCDTMAVSFADTIMPMITRYCSDPSNGSCHQAGNPNGPELIDHANIFAAIDRVEARALDISDMPPITTAGPRPLTACDRTLLQRWIDAGAPNN